MAEFVFDCVGARSDPYAAGPTLNLRLRVSETSGERVHAIALRCQVRIEPQRRRYSDAEASRLDGLFGDRSRWADTVRPLQLAELVALVPSFTGAVEIDVPMPCTYDLDIASTNYFSALDDGEVPILVLFSGTAFVKGQTGFSVTQVPWHKEASFRLPVAEWRAMMDRFFPDSGWIRLSRTTLDAVAGYKNARALPTWEQAITSLLEEASDRA